jgi:hypothetical protein
VHETGGDLLTLGSAGPELLNGAAGHHLLEVITPDCRLIAPEVCDRLQGVRLLALATATADGRPLVGPVDGVFFRGSFHFSSSPDSLRISHLRRRPQVSATHLPDESPSPCMARGR